MVKNVVRVVLVLSVSINDGFWWIFLNDGCMMCV